MKTNKVMKVVVALLVAIMLVTAFTMPSFARDEIDLWQFDNATEDHSNASNAVTNVIGSIISIARIVGAGVAIIMLIVLAIQYIAASPEGKAEIKKNSTIYIVGAVILFTASAILGIIQTFAESNIN